MPDRLSRTVPQAGKPCRCGRSVEATPCATDPWPGLDCDCCFAPIPGLVRGTARIVCDICAR
jgi:hypothetical protein